jgi:hypothetical protein
VLSLPVAAVEPVVNIATATRIKVEPVVVLVMPEMDWCAMDTIVVIAVPVELQLQVAPTDVEVNPDNLGWAVMPGPVAADILLAAAAAAGMVVAVATTMAVAVAVPAM